MREQRHLGRVGDVFVVGDVEALQKRMGNMRNPPTMEKGDVLVRRHHSGDCFSDFAVLREGRYYAEWAGYEPGPDAALRVGNAVDSYLSERGYVP